MSMKAFTVKLLSLYNHERSCDLFWINFKEEFNLWLAFVFTLREKCPNTELFLVPIFLYSVQIQENTGQK